MTPSGASATELVRWRQRERDVEALLIATVAEEARLQQELEKVEEQARYYDSLAGEMKRDVQPPSLSGLVRSLRW